MKIKSPGLARSPNLAKSPPHISKLRSKQKKGKKVKKSLESGVGTPKNIPTKGKNLFNSGNELRDKNSK